MEPDVVAVYQETNRERSVMKNSASHKKNGSAVAKLGNKRISDKEIAEKHGNCETYSLNTFMSFDEFKKLPDDLQVEYINQMQDRYDVGLAKLNDILFNQSEAGMLHGWLKIRGILDRCNRKTVRRNLGEEDLKADLAEYMARSKAVEIIDLCEVRAQKENDIPMPFMTWKQFIAMTHQQQVIFVNRVMETYGVGVSTISRLLFDSHKRLRQYLAYHGLVDQIDLTKLSGTSKSKTFQESLARFEKDVATWKENPGEPVEIEVPGKDVVEETPEKNAREEATIPESVTAKVEDPRVYYDASFVTSYASENGLDIPQLNALMTLFSGKAVRVKLEIMVI